MTNESQQSEAQGSTISPKALPHDLATEATALREARGQIASTDDTTREGEPPIGEALRSSDFPSHIHSNIRDFIVFADQKAGFVFTLAAALLAYQLNQSFHHLWWRPIESWALVASLSFSSMAALFLAAAAAAAVVLPRMSHTHEGFVFFRSIAKHASAAAYASSVLALQDSDLSRALLQHTFDLARICRRKYTILSWALWLVAFGLLSGFIALLLLPP